MPKFRVAGTVTGSSKGNAAYEVYATSKEEALKRWEDGRLIEEYLFEENIEFCPLTVEEIKA